MLRAVILDLDDTLVPETRAWQEALLVTCAPLEERIRVPAGHLAQAIEAIGPARYHGFNGGRDFDSRHGITWEECLWGQLGPESALKLPGLAAVASMLRATIWMDGLRACGVEAKELARELDRRYPLERRTRHRLYPEAIPVLQALRARGLTLACVTNGAPEVQREKLRESGIEPLFDVVLVSGEEGVGKPDPAILLLACDRIGVVPGEALYVGNSPARDVACAAAAGLGSVLLERPEGAADGEGPVPPAPDRVIFELTGLLGLVDGGRAGRAFRLLDVARGPLAVDEPVAEGNRFLARVGPEGDELRPAVSGPTASGAIQAGLRSLRARGGSEAFRHELGEPVDWDAVLR